MSSTKLRTPLYSLDEERHFALVDGFALPTVGSLVIVSGQDVSPPHASLRSAIAIMITTSNSSSYERSRTPNQLLDVRRNTMAISGLSCVRTELAPLL
jgi:hypothetical protein